jgi:hypothetical protein
MDDKTLWAIRIDKRRHRYLKEFAQLVGIILLLCAILAAVAGIKYLICEDKSKGMKACILPTPRSSVSSLR